MSPKKSTKYGGRRKDGKRKEEGIKLSELDKEVLTIKIKDLEEKLQRFQKKFQEMEIVCHGYKRQLEELSTDKQDIVAYLQRTLDQRADEIQELQERLDGLQCARNAERKSHDEQVGQLKAQYQETKDQLTSENIVLSGKLASLEEFKARKEEMTAKITELQDQLKRQAEEHLETVRVIEKNGILEKDKLKKEMMQNLDEIGSKFRQISNRQMAETTRRAIQENTSLCVQMESTTRKLGAVMEENQSLTELKRDHLLQISYLKGIEEDLLKRNVALTKVVKDEEVKLKDLEKERFEMRPYLTKCSALENEMKRLTVDFQNLEVETTKKQMALEQRENALEEMKIKFENLRIKQASTEAVLYNAASVLRDGLTVNSERVMDDILVMVEGHRDGTLSGLLDILNTADVAPTERLPAIVDVPKRQQMPRDAYFPGDVGIVPRLTKSTSTPHHQKMHAMATQTAHRMYSSSFRLPRSSPQYREARSAAYKIMHELACSTRQFVYKGDVDTLSRWLNISVIKF